MMLIVVLQVLLVALRLASAGVRAVFVEARNALAAVARLPANLITLIFTERGVAHRRNYFSWAVLSEPLAEKFSLIKPWTSRFCA